MKVIGVQGLKIGDKVRVIDGGLGARGCNGDMAIVVDRTEGRGSIIHGIGRGNEVLLKVLEKSYGVYWSTGKEATFELLQRNKPTKKHFDIDVLINGGKTKVVIGSKVGVARCNEEEDSVKTEFGVLIATARALGMSEEIVDGIVDVLYNDVKTVDDYTSEELLKVLLERTE